MLKLTDNHIQELNRVFNHAANRHSLEYRELYHFTAEISGLPEIVFNIVLKYIDGWTVVEFYYVIWGYEEMHPLDIELIEIYVENLN